MSDLNELVKQIDELYAKATPTTWEAGGSEDHGYGWIRGILTGQYRCQVHDAHLAAALHNAWPQIRDAIESLRRDGWIPVSERLPEFPADWPAYKSNIPCIVTVKQGHVLYMEWSRNLYAKTEKGKAARWTWMDKNAPWEVTHWRPLPEPPAAMKQTGGE